MTITEVKVKYIAAMKRLKSVIETRAWCCKEHALEVIAQAERCHEIKTIALEKFKAGEIAEEFFCDFITVGTEVINALADTTEAHMPSIEAAIAGLQAEDDVEGDVRINSPHGYA